MKPRNAAFLIIAIPLVILMVWALIAVYSTFYDVREFLIFARNMGLLILGIVTFAMGLAYLLDVIAYNDWWVWCDHASDGNSNTVEAETDESDM